MSIQSTSKTGRQAGLWLQVLCSFALLMVSSLALAAAPINTLKRGLISDSPTEIAINGYDPVAYFTDGKAVQGKDDFTDDWNGATWKFASASHLKMFKKDPEKYAPQYGGYCAYGVAQGYLVSIEPEQFTILDGKLYLNYDAEVQEKWLKHPQGFNEKADAKFRNLLDR
jgi:YHS domain-containing protein